MRSLILGTRPHAMAAPWALDSMNRQLENWMDRAFRGPLNPGREPRVALTPKMDVAETEKSYQITADVPGLDDKNVDVSVANDVLTIKGERTHAQNGDDRSVHRSERIFGSFERSFSLPEDIEQEDIKARLANGVLEIHLPKSKQATPPTRQIKVQTR